MNARSVPLAILVLASFGACHAEQPAAALAPRPVAARPPPPPTAPPLEAPPPAPVAEPAAPRVKRTVEPHSVQWKKGHALESIRELVASAYTTCALDQSGKVWCWGANADGEIGNGTMRPAAFASRVVGLADVAELAAGYDSAHFCALRRDRSVWCWGEDDMGELGDGKERGRARPGRVPGVSDVIQLDVQETWGCALRGDGVVTCWGTRAGSRDEPTKPKNVVGLPPVDRIALGHGHGCALDREANVWCWGSNYTGQLGDGTLDQRREARRVLANATGVFAGDDVSCATESDGFLRCWGADYLEPRKLSLRSVSALAVARGRVCADTPGGVYCWKAQNPSPRFHRRACRTATGQGCVEIPSPVERGVDPSLSEPKRVPELASVGSATFGIETCAIDRDGRVICFDQTKDGARAELEGLPPVSALTRGAVSACALTHEGRVVCWGRSPTGQLGDGTVDPPKRCPAPCD